MKTFKSIFAIIAVAFLACGIAAAPAPAPAPPGSAPGPGPMRGFAGHRGPLERALGPGSAGRFWNDPAMVEKLALSDDQRKTMDAILLQHRESLVDMHATVEKAELGMEPLMSADQPNEQQILAQIDKIAQARAELEKANARFLLAIRAKLTPDQWKQLQAARAERHQMRDGASPDGVHHRMRPQPGPAGGPTGGTPQAAPADGPGPQGMLAPTPAPSDAFVPEFGAIE